MNYNGEGMLFYPGEDAGIDGPIASIRLKNLRDGMEDYEYFTLLEKAKGKEAVDGDRPHRRAHLGHVGPEPVSPARPARAHSPGDRGTVSLCQAG